MNHPSLKDNTPQLGYFLKYRYWKNAIELLQYQLKIKENNRHFNTLSMFYYESLGKSAKKIKSKKYFRSRVANNLFYGLEDEFAVYPYPIPKSNLGLRNYKFLTYPMRVLYYSVALYLLHLSQELIQEYYTTHKNIQAEYGGKLAFNTHTSSLVLNYNSIWYQPHYKRFRNAVRREVKEDLEQKIFVHLDIQNYYDEISIPTLLNLLNEYVKPSIQKKMQFDPITQAQITAFFEFMANGKLGVPQSDNDIVSSYVGYLYLVFGDLLLEQEICKNTKIIKSHKITRYMDDIYISVLFKGEVSRSEREVYINSLSARIADCLYEKLGLRLNTKTRLFWGDKEEDVKDLLRSLKKVSPGYQISDNEDGTHPQEMVQEIFRQLEKLKSAPLDPSFDLHRELESETLKEVYTPGVESLLQKSENKTRIKEIFANFNFDLVIAQPKEILIVLLQDENADKAFREFLLSKRNLTSREVHLILTYLCQTNFQSPKLIRLLSKSHHMKQIMVIYRQRKVALKNPGYFGLHADQVLRLAKMHNVIDQIRLRILAEQKNQYSVALNHLLNEVHAVCFRLDTRKIDEKHYDAIRAIEFLTNSQVPHETSMKIRNLFDRRNKNPVSHADPIAWPVGKDEYFDYHYHAGICLSHILCIEAIEGTPSNHKP